MISSDCALLFSSGSISRFASPVVKISGCDDLAQLGGHFRSALGQMYFFRLERLDASGDDGARIQNFQRDGGDVLHSLDGRGGHAARDERAVHENVQREVRREWWSCRQAAARRKVPEGTTVRSSMYVVTRWPGFLHLVFVDGAHVRGNQNARDHRMSCGEKGTQLDAASVILDARHHVDRRARGRGVRQRRRRPRVCACGPNRGRLEARRAAALRARFRAFRNPIGCAAPGVTLMRSASCRVKSSEMYSCS